MRFVGRACGLFLGLVGVVFVCACLALGDDNTVAYIGGGLILACVVVWSRTKKKEPTQHGYIWVDPTLKTHRVGNRGCRETAETRKSRMRRLFRRSRIAAASC